MRRHQRGIDIDDHLSALAATGNTPEGTTPGPYPLPGSRADRPDRRNGLVGITGQGREQT